ncbi:unnamed protein product [Cyprideis torosa]|uniref:Uncharacterized protein n=1 Tax=Cyprideis torosa TaxID=163714 RepID=A0A7R8WAR5_9CRUS|nr:unnamed protein product [Cyprideis torosa]CAG0891381.1 unnamed protein product [Cyprideis torosa]
MKTSLQRRQFEVSVTTFIANSLFHSPTGKREILADFSTTSSHSILVSVIGILFVVVVKGLCDAT